MLPHGCLSFQLFVMQKDMFNVLDELLGPLNTHIAQLLSQPAAGTDDSLAHVDTKRSYLTLLISIISSDLHDVFISERKRVLVVITCC